MNHTTNTAIEMAKAWYSNPCLDSIREIESAFRSELKNGADIRSEYDEFIEASFEWEKRKRAAARVFSGGRLLD